GVEWTPGRQLSLPPRPERSRRGLALLANPSRVPRARCLGVFPPMTPGTAGMRNHRVPSAARATAAQHTRLLVWGIAVGASSRRPLNERCANCGLHGCVHFGALTTIRDDFQHPTSVGWITQHVNELLF